MTGRPLRFLMLTTGGWTAVRVALLWPTIDSVPALIRAVAPPVAAATASFALAPSPETVTVHPVGARSSLPVKTAATQKMPAAPIAPPPPPPRTETAPLQPPPLRLPSVAPVEAPTRWRGSLWAVARSGPGDARPGSQLGGSQAGVRLTYALRRRLAVAARLSSSFDGDQREAALGLDWQAGALPLHLIAERRIPLDRGRGGTAAMIVVGIDPRTLTPGLTIEAYGQAGAVLHDRIESFADGALRITHRLLGETGARVDLGLGSWAAAQRGIARVDVGPTLAVGVPVAGRRIRMTLDWRQRVAGHARPGSGPALTIGSDF